MPYDSDEDAPGVGHNEGPESKSDFLAWYNRLNQIEAEIESWKEKKKAVRKEMKAEGVTLANFDAWCRLMKLEQDEQARFFNDLTRWNAFVNSPLGEQFSFHFDATDPVDDRDDETREAQIKKSAYHEGYLAGARGTEWEDDNPHEVPSPAGQAWIEGYRDAQAEAARNLGGLDKAIDDSDPDGSTEPGADDGSSEPAKTKSKRVRKS